MILERPERGLGLTKMVKVKVEKGILLLKKGVLVNFTVHAHTISNPA